MRTFASTLALVAALGLAAPAYAHEAGDWLVRFGGSNVDPKSDNGSIDLSGTTILDVQDVTVDSKFGPTFNVAYMYTDTIGVELLAALPFKHDVNVAGLPEPAASVTHLPPTLSVQYYFMPGSAFRPYAGLGLNLTWFMDEDKKAGLAAADVAVSDALGTEIVTDIKVDSTSVGLAAQLGFDYMINEKWFLNVDVRWIDISTDATVTVNGADFSTAKVDVDPIVYGLHVGYRF